jgi:6-phosphogluconolactonase (cycloisomerase 2 family)
MTSSNRHIAYIGARTTRQRNARGNGLNVYRLEDGVRWTHLQLLELENPSFLAFDRTGDFLYTVHGDMDRVSAFAIDPASGCLTLIDEQSTEGRNPVHLAFDPENRFLLVANHVTSTLALLPRREDGTLGAVVDLVSISGKIGPHRVEQPFAKPHQVEFDPSGRYIAVPDKGLDKILVFRLDSAAAKLIEVSSVQTREGSGPRHLAFHPGGTLAYVVNELDSTVTAYRFDPTTGELQPFQILSALPDSFTAFSRGSEIAVSADGKFVYVSNRGSDTIGAFSLSEDGRMTPAGWGTTEGRTPRFFTFVPGGNRLLAANEDSDTVVTFGVDPATGGLLNAEATLSVGSPVCILLRPA